MSFPPSPLTPKGRTLYLERLQDHGPNLAAREIAAEFTLTWLVEAINRDGLAPDFAEELEMVEGWFRTLSVGYLDQIAYLLEVRP